MYYEYRAPRLQSPARPGPGKHSLPTECQQAGTLGVSGVFISRPYER